MEEENGKSRLLIGIDTGQCLKVVGPQPACTSHMTEYSTEWNIVSCTQAHKHMHTLSTTVHLLLHSSSLSTECQSGALKSVAYLRTFIHGD